MSYLGYIITPSKPKRETDIRPYKYSRPSSTTQQPTRILDNTFWQQLPEVTPLGRLHYNTTTGQYHPHPAFYNFSSIVNMGNKHCRGKALNPKKAQPNPIKPTVPPTTVSKASPPPPQIIDVYVSGTFVGSITRHILTRFSNEAALCFRKHEPSTKYEEERSPVAKVVSPPGRNSNKQLHLIIEGVAEQPTPDAIKICLDWMVANSEVRGDVDDLLPLAPADIDEYAAVTVIDIYAAAWGLDMRPTLITIKALRAVLVERLTKDMPTIAILDRIHARIPDFDPVHSRAVTAYVEWCEGTQYGRLSEQEGQAISNYVQADKSLNDKFFEVQQSRRKNWYFAFKADKAAKAAKRAAAEDALLKGWDDLKKAANAIDKADTDHTI